MAKRIPDENLSEMDRKIRTLREMVNARIRYAREIKRSADLLSGFGISVDHERAEQVSRNEVQKIFDAVVNS